MSTPVKIGITAPVPGVSPLELVELTRRYERGGFDSVWFPDHVVFMAPRETPEVWSVITAAAVKTRSIAMGAVGDAHRQHPAVFAHRLATIDRLSGGRVFACVGYGEKMNLDPYGISWDRPLRRVEESVKIMRALWKGGPVTFKGEIYKLRRAELRIKPVSEKGVPIYIAATAPRALRLAGRLGDGWVTNSMPPHLFRKKYDTVREGARRRPKSLGPLERAIYVFLSVAKTEDDAYSTLEPIKHALIWPELLEEGGYGIRIAPKYRGLQYTKIMPNDRRMLEKFKELGQRYYSRDVVMDFVIAGTKKQVLDRMEQYVEAGVDHFILRDFSPDRTYSHRVLSRDVIPHFRS